MAILTRAEAEKKRPVVEQSAPAVSSSEIPAEEKIERGHWWLMHPDFLGQSHDGLVLNVTTPGGPATVWMEGGKVETTRADVRDALLKMGLILYREEKQ